MMPKQLPTVLPLAVLAVLAVLAYCGIGCGGEADPGGESGSADAGSKDASAVAPDGAAATASGVTERQPSAGCGQEVSPGSQDREFEFGDMIRAYRLHVPAGYAGEPTPVVVNMHGFLSDQVQQEALSLMSPVADTQGFIVVYPAGAGQPLSWNGGSCCAFDQPERDDVAFIDALLDSVTSELCVDERRIYATGMSNGAFMAHRLACELSDRIAAVATVAGLVGLEPTDCTPPRPIPVMHFHGTADPLVKYPGGQPNFWNFIYPNETPPTFPPVEETIAFWREHNGCAEASEESFAMGNASCETWASCDDGVEVTACSFEGSGHTWPGGDLEAISFGFGSLATIVTGSMSNDLVASEAMWEFFERYPMPR